MAILQIKDFDDHLYETLKALAKAKRRSVSQEVIKIIEDYLSKPNRHNLEATEVFLNLSWAGEEDAEALIKNIRSARKNSKRFKGKSNVFD